MSQTFPGMTPELQSYVDHWAKEHTDTEFKYAESKRLRKLIDPAIYRAYRRFEIDAMFVDEKLDSRRETLSPSGKYKLVTSSFGTKPGCWSYAQGRLYAIGSDMPIAVVNRNYGSFPCLFVEGHPNGHDYFICGEDYQGQTVIELDTGRRRDFLPEEADDGFGFCWSDYRFDTTTQILTVGGCYWACPYEFRFFDFSDPMQGWPELENEVGAEEDSKYPTIEPDGTIRCYQTERAECDHDECPEHCKQKPVVDAATKTFRREGLKLVLVEEWVSEKEQASRARQEEGNRKYEQWLKDFKAGDPLYLLMSATVKEEPFKPEDHISIGQTHDQWHPTEKFQERRMCRRIHRAGGRTLDIEWGTDTAPIKLIVYRDGKHTEDRWFSHSVAGMTEALTYARTVLQ